MHGLEVALPPRGRGAPPSGLSCICRELHGSKASGEKSPTNGKPSVTISLESFQLPIWALRSRNSAGVMTPVVRASRPYCTPTLSHGTRAKPVSSVP